MSSSPSNTDPNDPIENSADTPIVPPPPPVVTSEDNKAQFAVGTKLDVLDGNLWRAASIIALESTKFKIHFEGW